MLFYLFIFRLYIKIFTLYVYYTMDRTGKTFWNDLGQPVYVAAPMVDMSELSFRLLCRSKGTQLCYSPMLHASQYLSNLGYRKVHFTTCDEDRPLIVQVHKKWRQNTIINGVLIINNLLRVYLILPEVEAFPHNLLEMLYDIFKISELFCA